MLRLSYHHSMNNKISRFTDVLGQHTHLTYFQEQKSGTQTLHSYTQVRAMLGSNQATVKKGTFPSFKT